jgi:hypothetical protein
MLDGGHSTQQKIDAPEFVKSGVCGQNEMIAPSTTVDFLARHASHAIE